MKIAAHELAILVAGYPVLPVPKYQQLANALRDLVTREELPTGCILPAERALAEEMNVSRTTVVAAYRDLQEEGLVDRRTGSGTRVTGAAGGDRSPVRMGSVSSVRIASPFLYSATATIDFATVAMAALPMVAEAAATDAATYHRLMSRSVHDVRGLPELRAVIAAQYTRDGLPTSESQILITSGAQHALEVIAEGCLQEGDVVLTEMPTYRGALEAFGHVGARIEGVPLDTHGIVVSDLEQRILARRPRMVFVQTQVHNPTGVSLSRDRARRMLQLAEEHGVIVVDDRSLADTSYDEPVRLLKPPANGATVLSIGSMNKLFWNGLRVGWIRGDSEVISRLARMKGGTEVGASLLSQHLSVSLLEDLDAARTARASELRANYEHLSDLLAEQLPDWTWWQPSGGPSLWVLLPHGDASSFAAHSIRLGVAVLPESVFAADGIIRPDRHIRLQFGLPASQLDLGVQRLAESWQTYDLDRRSQSTMRSPFN
jgi:DNA-binding transcriptional MocR family regulator